jgi:hypothetical protein
MVDTGATYSMVSSKWLHTKNALKQPPRLSSHQLDNPLVMSTANNQPVTVKSELRGMLALGKGKAVTTALLMHDMLESVDLILGLDWMDEYSAVLHVKTRTCTYKVNKKQYTVQPKTSMAASISAAQPCDDNKEDKVDIALVTAHQAKRMLRKKQVQQAFVFLVQKR